MEHPNLMKSAKTAILTKRSARDAGYFEDDFIDFFSLESKSPSFLNLYVYFRVHSISLVLKKFFDSFRHQKVQLVVLGGGLDTLPFVLLEKYDNLVCFENDFEVMMRSKASIMMNNPKFLKLLPDLTESSGVVTSERYKMVPFDLKDPDKVSMFFESGLSSQLPTVLLSDFSLNYLETKYSNKILKSFGDFFQSACLYVFFEPTPTLEVEKSSYSLRPERNHFEENIGWISHSTNDYPSFESLVERFNQLGWDGLHLKPMSYFFNTLSDSERERVLSLENDLDLNFLLLSSELFGLGVAYKNFKNTDFFNFLVSKVVNHLNSLLPDPEILRDFVSTVPQIISTVTDHYLWLSNLSINEHIKF